MNVQPTITTTSQALRDHIQEQQSKAMELRELLKAVLFLHNEGACDGGQLVILERCHEIAADMNTQLDSVNLAFTKIECVSDLVLLCIC